MRFTCGCLLVLCAVSSAPSLAGTVRGTVRDAMTLAPIADASLALHVINPDSIALPATSDVSGGYIINDVPPGNEIYVLTCAKANYSNYYARLQDPGSSELVYDVLLEVAPPPPPPGDPDTSEVTGAITTHDAGQMVPVAGATVTLRSGPHTFQVSTDAQGLYVMWVPPDVYSATVSASGYETINDAGLPAEPGGLTYNAILENALASVPHPLGAHTIVLGAAFPNPVRGATTIPYTLQAASHVVLRIHDPMGREIRTLIDGWQPAGNHSIPFKTLGLPGGTYFCVLKVGDESARTTITILR